MTQRIAEKEEKVNPLSETISISGEVTIIVVSEENFHVPKGFS